MRKSVVFALVLATMFFLGTSNAGAGNGPVFFDLCVCESGCYEGFPAAMFGARVVNDSGLTIDVFDVEVGFDSTDVPLAPTASSTIPPGGDAFFNSDIIYPLTPGSLNIACSDQYVDQDGNVFSISVLTGTCDIPTCEIQVPVDIRPQSCPNPLSNKSKGVLPVAILGTDDFNPTTVDPATVALGRADGVGGTVSPLLGPPGPQPYIEDVGTPFNGAFSEDCYDCTEEEGDGILDLTLKFSIQDFLAVADGFGDGDCVPLQLTGATYDGTPFSGSDNVLMRVK